MSIAENFEIIADEVYEKGKKDEYDKFWDAFQNAENGVPKRTNYNYAFQNGGFNFDNFYPKYDIVPVGAYGTQMFYNWKVAVGKYVGSLSQRFKECGVILDTSQCTNLGLCFAYGGFTEIPTIDLSNLTQASGQIFAYNYNYLKTIEKIIISENTVISANWFTEDTGLENLTIEGTIGKSGFNVSACTKLSGASIVSIIEALSTTTSGLTVTLSQTAVNNMKFTDYDDEGVECLHGNEGTYYSWSQLEQSRTNWTISLV